MDHQTTRLKLSAFGHAFIPLAIASASVRKSASPHRSSARNGASLAGSLILVGIGISLLSPFPTARQLKGADLSRPLQTKRPAGFRLLQQRRSCETSS